MKEEAIVLRDNVNNTSNLLEMFDENWHQYVTNKKKLLTWMQQMEKPVRESDPTQDVKKFWVGFYKITFIMAYNVNKI